MENHVAAFNLVREMFPKWSSYNDQICIFAGNGIQFTHISAYQRLISEIMIFPDWKLNFPVYHKAITHYNTIKELYGLCAYIKAQGKPELTRVWDFNQQENAWVTDSPYLVVTNQHNRFQVCANRLLSGGSEYILEFDALLEAQLAVERMLTTFDPSKVKALSLKDLEHNRRDLCKIRHPHYAYAGKCYLHDYQLYIAISHGL